MTTQKKTTIGGQAIIEGIVMKGPKKSCTVVRQGEWRACQQDRTDAEPCPDLGKANLPRRVYAVYRHEGGHAGHQLLRVLL